MKKPDPCGGTIVYGCSDDCIEFEGLIHDEIYGEGKDIKFDDGTILRFDYGIERNGKKAGIWGITVIKMGPALIRVKLCAPEDEESSSPDVYSDVAIFNDEVKGFVWDDPNKDE